MYIKYHLNITLFPPTSRMTTQEIKPKVSLFFPLFFCILLYLKHFLSTQSQSCENLISWVTMMQMGYWFPDNQNYVISQINLSLSDNQILPLGLHVCKRVCNRQSQKVWLAQITINKFSMTFLHVCLCYCVLNAAMSYSLSQCLSKCLLLPICVTHEQLHTSTIIIFLLFHADLHIGASQCPKELTTILFYSTC